MIDPKKLIQTLSVEELAVTADNYFKAITNPLPQMAKPFMSLDVAPHLLQNFGLLLDGMRIGMTMTVLEFGAGTCWLSRFLNELQCRTISCDVSQTALDIGKRAFKEFPTFNPSISPPAFLHFDGHKINLPDESVDRIICNDAFHHVPNQEEVIAELARVLKKGGIAGFCEPGKHHSQTAQSQYEMQNFNVLENDIDVIEIYAMAKKYGFDDIEFKLLADMNITLPQYQTLTSNAMNTSTHKIIANHVRSRMINGTIFFLHKGRPRPDSRAHIGLSHKITTEQKKLKLKVGELIKIPLSIQNNGEARWISENVNDIGVIRIGTHLYDNKGNMINIDFGGHRLKSPVESGETINETISLHFTEPGIFHVSVDLVSEFVCWFENVGAKPLQLTISVDA